MERITYTLSTGLLTGPKEILCDGDNLTVELAIDSTGTKYEDWEKRCDLQIPGGTDDILGFLVPNTDIIAVFVLTSAHLKNGALVVNPYVQKDGARKGFPKRSITVVSQLNKDTATSSVRILIEDYINTRLTVKSVTATTLAPSEPATLNFTIEADGVIVEAGVPQGETGDEGLSAYEVWLAEGNVGTEADYLLSLKGLKGDKGNQWRGAYSSATAYVVDDVVSYLGSSYICVLASTNNLPTNATYWDIFAQAIEIPSVSVKLFGAMGDGVTNDTLAFEAAEDSLPDEGGIIYVPQGIYIVSYRMRKANTTLQGSGFGSVLKTQPNAVKLISDCPVRVFADNCIIRDLTIDGNAGNNPALAASADMAREADGIGIYANYCVVENVWTRNILGHHIIVWNDNFDDESYPAGARHHNSIRYNVIVKNELGMRNATDFASTKELGENLDQNINYSNEFIGNKLINAEIVVHTGTDVLIADNDIYNNGISIHTASKRVQIVNNRIHGGRITVQGGLLTLSGETQRRTKDIVCTGNIIRETGGGVIFQNVDGAIIADNIINSTATEAQINGCTDVKFKNNKISKSGVGNAIYIGASLACDRITIEDNVINNTQFGVVARYVNDIRIKGNQIYGGVRAVSFDFTDATRVFVGENNCYNQNDYALYLTSKCHVKGNCIYDCIDPSYAFFVGSNGTIVDGNYTENTLAANSLRIHSSVTNLILINNIFDKGVVSGALSSTLLRNNIISNVYKAEGI